MDKIVINHGRANRYFARLIGELRKEEFPYTARNMGRRPQEQVPKELWNNANFWFYLCHLMRGMIKSDHAANQAVELYRLNPKLFDPSHAATLTAEEIDKELKRVFSSVPKWQRYGEAWQRNSEILLAWGGDILNVYKGVRTEAELRKRVVNKRDYNLPLKERGFYMFQVKMCSLLTYFLMCAGLIRTIRMSPPIDFHHMRVMIGTGMIELPSGQYRPEKITELGDQLGRAYLDRFPRMSPVMFADLLFVLSREGCVQAVTEPDPDWEDPEIWRRYQKGCGRCPLEDVCDKTIVTGDYYVRDGNPRSRFITVIPRPNPPARIRRRGV